MIGDCSTESYVLEVRQTLAPTAGLRTVCHCLLAVLPNLSVPRAPRMEEEKNDRISLRGVIVKVTELIRVKCLEQCLTHSKPPVSAGSHGVQGWHIRGG